MKISDTENATSFSVKLKTSNKMRWETYYACHDATLSSTSDSVYELLIDTSWNGSKESSLSIWDTIFFSMKEIL